MTKEIDACRICGNKNLLSILDLGNMACTGVFPRSKDEKVNWGQLHLVKCTPDENNTNVCGLVQLKHTFESDLLYGRTYGYRSGLNQWMVRHLQGITKEIEGRIPLKQKDLIVDIGSNNGTLLSSY